MQELVVPTQVRNVQCSAMCIDAQKLQFSMVIFQFRAGPKEEYS